MQLIGFPLCCGASIISNLSVYNQTPENVEKLLSAELKKILGTQSYTRAFVTAIATSAQHETVWPVFKAAGFQCVSRGINGNHNSLLYMYVLSNKPTKDFLDKAKETWKQNKRMNIYQKYLRHHRNLASEESAKKKQLFNIYNWSREWTRLHTIKANGRPDGVPYLKELHK